MEFRIHHRKVTESTNADARAGRAGDVYTADEQTAGRGRLDHRWLSAPGENLMMSAVFDVDGMPLEVAATFPLMVGLAVRDAVEGLLPSGAPKVLLKWPNDVLAAGRKLAGILCERRGGLVVAGIGLNVNQTDFAPEIAERATSLAVLRGRRGDVAVDEARDAVLRALAARYSVWREGGFAAMHGEYSAVDALAGRIVEVALNDGDATPARGLCGGVAPDGSLIVGGSPVFAGEAHVIAFHANDPNQISLKRAVKGRCCFPSVAGVCN